jgi:hypothetical protein
MSGPYYFAWCDEGTTFGVGVQVEDEAIFELEVAQIEGDFAMLTIEVANPRIGLLGPGRHQWCWVSWFDGVSVVALFHGRLVGVPERLTDEVVRLLFIARPSDYPARKEALAATLRVLPWSDPVFLVEGVGDPDTVIEARSALYHIDRTTLEVTVSDVLDGEDGLIDVSEAEHFYDAVEVTFGATPLRQIVGTATLTFTQAATGEVDLTAPLVAVFQAAGSPYPWPLVSSYTGDGLLSSWPAPNTSLSGGWSMAPDSTATLATAMQAESFAVRYIDKSDNTDVLGFDRPAQEIGGTSGLNLGFQGSPHDFFINWKNFDVVFTCSPIIADFKLSYAASRKRSEVVSFTVSADVQSILTDPAGAEIETLTLNSTLVDQPAQRLYPDRPRSDEPPVPPPLGAGEAADAGAGGQDQVRGHLGQVRRDAELQEEPPPPRSPAPGRRGPGEDHRLSPRRQRHRQQFLRGDDRVQHRPWGRPPRGGRGDGCLRHRVCHGLYRAHRGQGRGPHRRTALRRPGGELCRRRRRGRPLQHDAGNRDQLVNRG